MGPAPASRRSHRGTAACQVLPSQCPRRSTSKRHSLSARQRASELVACCDTLFREIFRGWYVKASILYRISSVLMLLLAVAHTFGFRQSDPDWGIDTLLGSMRSLHFDV